MTADVTKYNFQPADVALLKALAILPADMRLELLQQKMQTMPETYKLWLTDLFVNFIGMANSVVANNREMIELEMITTCRVMPHDADKINLPTISGALHGIGLTKGINPEKICEGCAFRLGTPANQSPITTLDAEYCHDEGADFMCHMHLKDGEPIRKCLGFVQQKGRPNR